MKRKERKIPYKKMALALSLCALLVWSILGAGVSLAWFADTTEDITNIFHFGEFKLKVSHRTDSGSWHQMDSTTEIFDREALYEPGYTQTVYLKVENQGDIPFMCYTAVTATDVVVATNVFGQDFLLHEYLRFGIGVARSEGEMEELVSSREKANALAKTKLQNYEKTLARVAPGEEVYIALVVRMPEQIGNEANYMGSVVPMVALGVIIKAEQTQ